MRKNDRQDGFFFGDLDGLFANEAAAFFNPSIANAPAPTLQYFGAEIDASGEIVNPEWYDSAEGFETREEVEGELTRDGYSEMAPGIWVGPDGARIKIIQLPV